MTRLSAEFGTEQGMKYALTVYNSVQITLYGPQKNIEETCRCGASLRLGA